MDRLLIFLIVIWKPHGEEGNRVYFLSCFAAFFFFFFLVCIVCFQYIQEMVEQPSLFL